MSRQLATAACAAVLAMAAFALTHGGQQAGAHDKAGLSLLSVSAPEAPFSPALPGFFR
jgi:hypothetical protein